MPKSSVLQEIKELKSWLYGADGHTGDITEIKGHLAELNDNMLRNALQIQNNKTNIKWLVRILIASGIMGGSGAGIWRLLN